MVPTNSTITRRAAIAGMAALAACSSKSAVPRTTSSKATQLLAAARKQIGVTLAYDPGYTRIPYPGGDVVRSRGVCTDVVIRAYRDAFGVDLQALVHTDMASAFKAYPQKWSLPGPDSNIDHRRVPNLATFFHRQRAELPIPSSSSDWQAGDIFVAHLLNGATHTGLISDKTSSLGRPLVIHNWGSGTQEESAWTWLLPYGRFRFLL